MILPRPLTVDSSPSGPGSRISPPIPSQTRGRYTALLRCWRHAERQASAPRNPAVAGIPFPNPGPCPVHCRLPCLSPRKRPVCRLRRGELYGTNPQHPRRAAAHRGQACCWTSSRGASPLRQRNGGVSCRRSKRPRRAPPAAALPLLSERSRAACSECTSGLSRTAGVQPRAALQGAGALGGGLLPGRRITRWRRWGPAAPDLLGKWRHLPRAAVRRVILCCRRRGLLPAHGLMWPRRAIGVSAA